MANFEEPVNPGFPGVYILDFEDDAIGGDDGISNRQPKQLMERTAYLKKEVGRLETDIGASLEEIKEETQKIESEVGALKGRGGYLTAFDFGTGSPSQEEITDYALSQIHQTEPAEIWNGTRVKNLNDGHVWILTNTPDTNPPIFEWSNNGLDSIGQADNSGKMGAVTGAQDLPDGSNDGFITITPAGQQRLIGFEKLQKRMVGEYRQVGRVLSAAEQIMYRLIPLDYRLIEIALYQELCDRKYVGDALNAAADWWYKCDHLGNRTPTGLFMRVEDTRGLFPRIAGKNAVKTAANDTPYDGGEIGAAQPDAIGLHGHELTLSYGGPGGIIQAYTVGGWNGIDIQTLRTDVQVTGGKETKPASHSRSEYMQY